MNIAQLAALLALSAIWGASYIFIRVAVEPFGPFLLMFSRVAISAVILLGYARLRGMWLDLLRHWRKFLVLGFLGSAMPFVLIAWAELTVTASMAAILMSTTPLFATLVAAVGLGEKLTASKLLGALLGIIGVTITVGGSALSLDTDVIAASAALLLATLCYALGGVFAKRYLTGLSHMALSSGQLLSAAILLAPVSLADLPLQPPPLDAALALLALAILCTAFAYQLYYYLIISAGPTKALTVTLLIPVFGVLMGGVLLQEPISSGMLIGLVIVLFSVGLVTGMISPPQRHPYNKILPLLRGRD